MALQLIAAVDTETKECRNCGQTKSRGEFYKSRRTPTGLRAMCKRCTLEIEANGIKRCVHFRRTKSLADFPKRAGAKRGTASMCSSCAASGRKRCVCCYQVKQLSEYGASLTQHGRIHVRSKCNACMSMDRRLGRYRITKEQHDAMHVAQGGRCAICRVAIAGSNCHVDHDHATGKVRGLLCETCNPGLGCFRDDPLRLRAAIAYLESGGWR